jgi:hypothetical protein
MADIRIIETMGSITKVEKLRTLDSNILENTLVLDEIEPYPGYHGANLPTGYNTATVYLVTRKKMSSLQIRRMTQDIKKYIKEEFDGTPAAICINNSVLNCIRIRHIDGFGIIPVIQKGYLHEGIKFMKKKNFSGEGIIEINKHFELEDCGDGVYKDLEDPLMYYVRIPRHMNWQMFLKITTSIKRNIDDLSFDGALGAIYLKEIIDVVRIFAKDMTTEDLKKIRNLYLEEFKKY